MELFLFLPAWRSQDLLSVSQAPIVLLEEGRHRKSQEIAAWSNSVVTIINKITCKTEEFWQ